MANKKTNNSNEAQNGAVEDFSADLIKAINKEHNEKIAFNLGVDDAPTNIKRWISTGSRQLDYIVSNRGDGGLPEGRVIEIQGAASIGKSHIAFLLARNTQKANGIVIYIDTENATNLENLQNLGIDVRRRFVFVQSSCTEEIFQVMESAIIKAKAMNSDVPVTIIWDSVAASSPRAELEGDYDQNTIGLQARVIGKGLRKIVNLIGNQKVLLLLINQQRMKIGVLYGDPHTTPGGMAIPYCSSVRIRLNGGKHVEVNGQVVGIQVIAKTIKNKVAQPFRECTFQIHFGKGIVEHEDIFDLLRGYCKSAKLGGVTVGNKTVSVAGEQAWKTFTVVNNKTGEVETEVKFYKPEFQEKVLSKPEFKTYVDALMDAALIIKPGEQAKEHMTYTGIDNGAGMSPAELEA